MARLVTRLRRRAPQDLDAEERRALLELGETSVAAAETAIGWLSRFLDDQAKGVRLSPKRIAACSDACRKYAGQLTLMRAQLRRRLDDASDRAPKR